MRKATDAEIAWTLKTQATFEAENPLCDFRKLHSLRGLPYYEVMATEMAYLQYMRELKTKPAVLPESDASAEDTIAAAQDLLDQDVPTEMGITIGLSYDEHDNLMQICRITRQNVQQVFRSALKHYESSIPAK